MYASLFEGYLAELGDTGILDEHAAPEKGSASKTYAPTEQETRAVHLVERLFKKAKAHRSRYDKDWAKFYRLFRGKQWDTPRPSFRHSEIVNHIFKSIQSTVPIQMDARPRFEFLPEEPADFELSEILNQAAEADWSWDHQVRRVLDALGARGPVRRDPGPDPGA